MKRILFSLMVLAAVLSVAGVGSLAYFSDIETSDSNTFEAGTWALELDEGDTNIGMFEVADTWAGDSGTKTWILTNVGTVPGYVDLENISLAEDIGELGNCLMIHLFNGSDIYGMAGSPAPIKGIAGNYDLNLPLEPGESNYITLDWEVSGAYEPIEGDKVELTITFELQAQP